MTISISIAYNLQRKGKCKILDEEQSEKKIPRKTAKQIKTKSEKDPSALDKKAAEG